MNLTKNIIFEIIAFLEKNITTSTGFEILTLLKDVSLSKVNFMNTKPNFPPKDRALRSALSSINCKELYGIRDSISAALTSLKWNIDDGEFYDKNSQIGEDYLLGNMNTELIGPRNGIFQSNELRLGLFLLEENIFYKDHKHKAPELYVNLTEGTKWRFEDLKWQDNNPGTIIYNEPFKVHAMKVGAHPFLSVWCWPKDSTEKCILVPKPDWV